MSHTGPLPGILTVAGSFERDRVLGVIRRGNLCATRRPATLLQACHAAMRVFLSYRTLNSDFVRLVADWLEYNGVATWFAEKDIPLDFQFEEQAIEELIRQGVGGCSHALLFTNLQYLASDWCRLEAQSVLARRGGSTKPERMKGGSGFGSYRPLAVRQGPSNVIEVCIPHHDDLERHFWGLDRTGVSRLLMSPQDLPAFDELERCMRSHGWPIPEQMKGLVSSAHSETKRFSLPILGLTLDLSGWNYDDRQVQRNGAQVVVSDYFSRNLDGPVQLCISAWRYPPGLGPRGAVEGDDRELRRQTVEYARHYSEHVLPALFERPCRILGVHLVRCGSRFHFALSYALDLSRLGTTAARKYSLVGWDPVTRSTYELVFTFQVLGNERRLLGLSPLCDAVVRSLRVDAVTLATFRALAGTGDWTDPAGAHTPKDQDPEEHPVLGRPDEMLPAAQVFFEGLPHAKVLGEDAGDGLGCCGCWPIGLLLLLVAAIETGIRLGRWLAPDERHMLPFTFFGAVLGLLATALVVCLALTVAVWAAQKPRWSFAKALRHVFGTVAKHTSKAKFRPFSSPFPEESPDRDQRR